MEELEDIIGKYFSIMEDEDSTIVIYIINRNVNNGAKNLPKYNIERLESNVTALINGQKRRTFFVENPAVDGNHLLIFTFKDGKIVVNTAFLDYDSVIISKKNISLNMQILYNDQETEYKDFYYNTNMQRQLAIIDIETTEEIKPSLYIDQETNTVKGKCTLQAHRKYFAFEIKEKNKNI